MSEAQLAELRGLTAKNDEEEDGSKPKEKGQRVTNRPFTGWVKTYGGLKDTEKSIDLLLYEYPQEEDGPGERDLPHQCLARLKEYDLVVISTKKIWKPKQPPPKKDKDGNLVKKMAEVDDMKEIATPQWIVENMNKTFT
jgi:hypothetical protein